MINPNDIFNAHRVIGTPSQYRPAKITRPMILPMRGTLRSAERRNAVGRVISQAARTQARTLRETFVRTVLPIVRKR